MKIAILMLAAGLALPAMARADQQPAPRNNVCLQASNVRDTVVVDDRTILFRMNDGKVWRNTLPRSCPDLKFENGFSQVIRGGTICSHLEMIRVLRTDMPCMLGDFTLDPKPVKAD